MIHFYYKGTAHDDTPGQYHQDGKTQTAQTKDSGRQFDRTTSGQQKYATSCKQRYEAL